jgi:NAD(P)-dependent dehydrogenase (short-subunit alcohol dehydrogenase family)
MTDPFSLEGRVVVVTGAGGLLGRHHVQALAGAGAHVVAADLFLEDAEKVLAPLAGRHLPVEVDITDPAAVAAMTEVIMGEFGRVDALVNNAAANDMVEAPDLTGDLSRFEVYPLEQWRRMLDVNVTGTFLVTQSVGTVMADAGAGSIVNIASTYGLVGPDQTIYRKADGSQPFHKSPAYPTSKGAVIAFTRYLAAYWGHLGVRVNTLSPGGVENHQDDEFVRRYVQRTPLGRMASPSDYAGALIFLCSDASLYMTGANLVVDGGWTTW